jgi:hypothetical protein
MRLTASKRLAKYNKIVAGAIHKNEETVSMLRMMHKLETEKVSKAIGTFTKAKNENVKRLQTMGISAKNISWCTS